jgi:chitinase
MLTGNTCYDLGGREFFLVTPEYPVSWIARFVEDIESSESEYDLVWCRRLFEGGTGLCEEELDGWVGG